MVAVLAAAAIALTPGVGLAKRYAQARAGQPAVADTRILACHRWYGAVKCRMEIRWRSGVRDIDVVLVARCRGHVQAWDAAVRDGCVSV